MAKEARRKFNKSIIKDRPSPIVVVPDKSYIGATGDIIPTDVILIADATVYQKMSAVLEAWRRLGVGPTKKGIIEG